MAKFLQQIRRTKSEKINNYTLYKKVYLCQVCQSNYNDHIHLVEKANAAFCYKNHLGTELGFTPDSNIPTMLHWSDNAMSISKSIKNFSQHKNVKTQNCQDDRQSNVRRA